MIKNIYKVSQIPFLFFLTFTLFQCTNDSNEKTGDIETEKIKYSLNLQRFDEDLFRVKNAKELAELEKKYPDFYPVYMYQIMGDITQTNQSAYEAAANLMRNFSTIEDFGLQLKYRVDSVFPDLTSFKNDLTEAMKRYLYFFPKDTVPQFVTFVSPLRINFPFIEESNIMGIGLDMYLGSDFKPYHSIQLADQFPNYRLRKMTKEYLLRDLIMAMCQIKLKENDKDKRLIDEMIYEGKLLYMVHALLPDVQDSIKMGYTAAHLKWAKQNESEIWAALVDSKALYITEPDQIRHYISDAPFTTAKGFGNGTAPRIGAYIGLKIIEKYMAKNPSISMAQLLTQSDADLLLNASKYKP